MVAFGLAAALFLYATLRLLQGSHADAWKAAAMGSLYACCCLVRRGAFASTAARQEPSTQPP